MPLPDSALKEQDEPQYPAFCLLPESLPYSIVRVDTAASSSNTGRDPVPRTHRPSGGPLTPSRAVRHGRMWTPPATGLAGPSSSDADHVGTDGVPGVVEHT